MGPEYVYFTICCLYLILFDYIDICPALHLCLAAAHSDLRVLKERTMKRLHDNSGPVSRVIQYLILIFFSLLALFPIALVIMNSFKSRKAIFASPLAFPTSETFSMKGYNTVITRSNYTSYFGNSLTVTLISLALIILFGAMAAWALVRALEPK